MLQSDHALFRSIFECASVGIVTVDHEQRLAHCNLAFSAMLGYEHRELVGLPIADVIFPRDTACIEPELVRPSGERPFQSQWLFRRKDGSSFAGTVLSSKSPDGWSQAIVLDNAETNRLEALYSALEQRDRYFSRLERRLRDARTTRETIRVACEVIGQELGAALAGIGELHPDGKHIIVDNAWSASGELALLLCQHAVSRIARPLIKGVAAVEDVLTDYRLAEDEGAQAAYKAVGARSSIAVPLTRDGRPWAVLFVADKTPRAWSGAEIALVQETLERVWHAVERARAEEDLRLTTERFQHALKGSPVTLFCQDLDLRYTWISQSSTCQCTIHRKAARRSL